MTAPKILLMVVSLAAASVARAEVPKTTLDEAAPRVALAPAPAGAPEAIRFDGSFWTDTGYMKRANALAADVDTKAMYMQGRLVLGGNYQRQVGGLIALARVELVGFVNEYSKSQYEPHTQDAYVKLGTTTWDVQVGRFLAWEPYYRGQGIEWFSAEEAGALGGPAMYRLDFNMGRQDEAGQAAVHWFPVQGLGFEVASVYGQQNESNWAGVRPVVDWKWQNLELIGGWEYQKQSPQANNSKIELTSQGFGGRAQYSRSYLTVGVDAFHAKQHRIDTNGDVDTKLSLSKTTLGGFADLDVSRYSFGLGYHLTTQKNDRDEKPEHGQMFVSALYRFPIEGLTIKAVLGYAKAYVENQSTTKTSWNNEMTSFRVRLRYDYK